MHRLLRPVRLEVDPNDTGAPQAYKHWLKTFNSFAEAAQLAVPVIDGERAPVDKLGLLINHLSPQIYAYIEEASTFDEAARSLKSTYLKTKNVTFARHLLVTRVQKPGESLAEFFHALRELAKDCEYQNVTAEVYKSEMIRDAFISGVSSSAIRQRLLEETGLDEKSAYDRAELLDRAQKQSGTYVNTTISSALPMSDLGESIVASTPTVSRNQAQPASRWSTNSLNRSKCYFCGGSLHPRIRCPARNINCGFCGKKGHLQQATSPAKQHTPTSRVWQGEAFDIKQQSPMICPTPCLKLRNVFEPDMEVSKNWIQQIQDSILEKCRGNKEVLRICVEKDSKEGLVYMLCATKQAAGHAFQALHGAWFDGRLVTVKFIRLHRFHQRFPESANPSLNSMRPTSDVAVSTIIAPQSSSAGVQQYVNLYPTLPSE